MFRRRKTKTTLFIILTLIVMVLNVGGISAAKDIEGKDELVVAMAYDATSLDPHEVNDVPSSNAMFQIYDTLVKVDENGNIEKSVAKEYERVDDLTYRFTIKEGIKFHNGNEMTAEDVKFSIKRAGDSAAIAHIFGDIDNDSFKIHDKYTLSFKLNNPNTGFLASLAHTGGSILNKEAVMAAGDNFSNNIVGSGPFKFERWDKNSQIVLNRFNDYHGKKPEFSKMTIKIIPEATSRTIGLETGELDVAYQITTNDISRVEAHPDLKLIRKLDNSISYLGFNNQKEPFDNIKVRKAINYAINVPAIVNAVFRGVGEVAEGPMSPNVMYHNGELKKYEYNIEKAKQLLEEAGYPDGFKTKIWTNEKEARVDMATIIQSQLKQIGIDVETEILEWGAYLDGLSRGEQDMFIIGWTCQTTDPDLALYAPFSKETIGSGANFAFFRDDEINELLLKGRQIENSSERENIYKDIQEKIVEKAPWVFLANGEAVIGTANYIENLNLTPFGFHPLHEIQFKN